MSSPIYRWENVKAIGLGIRIAIIKKFLPPWAMTTWRLRVSFLFYFFISHNYKILQKIEKRKKKNVNSFIICFLFSKHFQLVECHFVITKICLTLIRIKTQVSYMRVLNVIFICLFNFFYLSLLFKMYLQ